MDLWPVFGRRSKFGVFETVITCLTFTGLSGCNDWRKIDQTQLQVDRLAQELDRRTTKTGVYIRVPQNEVKEKDAWGTVLEVTYEQGGVAEIVVVRSAGPDRQFHTADDLTAQALSTNLKGVGEGIKQNAEETAANVSKGIVKGVVAGVKESIQEAKSKRKKDRKDRAEKQGAD